MGPTCLNVQGKFPPQIQPSKKLPIPIPVSVCFIYCILSPSCDKFHVDWWGIHQFPPSTSLYLSTSTNYTGNRLRNTSVPWDSHASMVGLLAFSSGYTSMTHDRLIPKMFDFSSIFAFVGLYLKYLESHRHQWWFLLHLLTIYLNDR